MLKASQSSSLNVVPQARNTTPCSVPLTAHTVLPTALVESVVFDCAHVVFSVVVYLVTP